MARVVSTADCENAFFFGTLMHPAVLHRVIGQTGAGLVTVDADLPGFSRHHLRGVDYPAIVPAEDGERIMGRQMTSDEATVRGRMVSGLSAQDIRSLDIFEGDEYSREIVDVRPITARGSAEPLVKAFVYRWDHLLSRLEPRLWSFEDFVRDKASLWVNERTQDEADDGFLEVDRRRALNGDIARQSVQN